MKNKLYKKIQQVFDTSKYYGRDNAIWELIEEIERFIDDRIKQKEAEK